MPRPLSIATIHTFLHLRMLNGMIFDPRRKDVLRMLLSETCSRIKVLGQIYLRETGAGWVADPCLFAQRSARAVLPKLVRGIDCCFSVNDYLAAASTTNAPPPTCCCRLYLRELLLVVPDRATPTLVADPSPLHPCCLTPLSRDTTLIRTRCAPFPASTPSGISRAPVAASNTVSPSSGTFCPCSCLPTTHRSRLLVATTFPRSSKLDPAPISLDRARNGAREGTACLLPRCLA